MVNRCTFCNRYVPDSTALFVRVDGYVDGELAYRAVEKVYAGVRVLCNDCRRGIAQLNAHYPIPKDDKA